MRASHEDGLRRAGQPARCGRGRGVAGAARRGRRREPGRHAGAADDATKMHTTAFDDLRRRPTAARSGGRGRAASCVERPRGARRRASPRAGGRRTGPPRRRPGSASDGSLLDAAVAAGAGGIVVAATGAGNTAPGCWPPRKRAIGGGIAGRARVALPGRGRLDGLRLPGRRRDLGPRRGDPGRHAVRDQGACRPRARAGRRSGPRTAWRRLLADPLG